MANKIQETMKSNQIPINEISYRSEILNKVYPNYFTKRIYKELKNLIHEICYVPIWNNSLENIQDWDKQTIPLGRFHWIRNYNLVLADSNKLFNSLESNNSSSLGLKDAASLISQIYKETREIKFDKEDFIIKEFVKSNQSFTQWQTKNQSDYSNKIVKPFYYHLIKTKPTGLKAVLLQGSLADGFVKPGFSDYDVNYIIDLAVTSNQLIDLMKWIYDSNKFLLSFNPFMHHGPMVVLEDELSFCSEATLPSTIIENGIWLFGNVKEIKYSQNDYELIDSFHQFNEFFLNRFQTVEDIKSIFDIVWWVSSVFFLPLLNIQLLTNKSFWKRDILTNKKEIPEQYWGLIDQLTEIRNKTSEYVLSRISLPIKFKEFNFNPGQTLYKFRNEFKLETSKVTALGLTDDLIQIAKELFKYYETIAIEKNKINFTNKGYEYEKVNNNWIKEVSEIPEQQPIEKYEEVRREFLQKCELNKNVIAVYEFGSIGCPGLSDLDFLVVLSDDYFGIPSELLINNMTDEQSDIMNHDPIFVSQSQLETVAAITPIFNYNQILGKKLDFPTSQSFNKEIQEICYTIQNIRKYPFDLIALSKQQKTRWKTFLAFLNSFNHIKKTLSISTTEIPASVQECIELNSRIRADFSSGKLSLEDLNSAFDKMISASIDVVNFYQRHWESKLPSLKINTSQQEAFDFGEEVYKAIKTEEDIFPELPVALKTLLKLTEDITFDGSENYDGKELTRLNHFFRAFNKLKNSYLIYELSRGRRIHSYIVPNDIVDEHLNRFINTEIHLNKSEDYNFNTPVLFVIKQNPQQTFASFNILKIIKPKKLYVYINNNGQLREFIQILLNINWSCELKTKIDSGEADKLNVDYNAIEWLFENEENGIVCESQTLSDVEDFYSIENLLKVHNTDKNIVSISNLDPIIFDSVKKNSMSLFLNNPHKIFGTWRDRWKHYDAEMLGYLSFISEDHFYNGKFSEVELETVENNLFNAFCSNKESFFIKWNFNALIKNLSMIFITKMKNHETELSHTTIDFSQFEISKKIKPERVANYFCPDKIEILIYKSEVAIAQNNLVFAKDLLNTILKLDGDNLNALNNLAVIETMEDNYAEAVSILKRLLLIDPYNEVALENIMIIKGILEEKQILQ